MSSAQYAQSGANFNRVSDSDIAAARAVPLEVVVGPLRHDYRLCPFHDERTPSFHVHRATNRWACFGCGAKGDTIEFVRRSQRLDFAAAVMQLINAPRDLRTARESSQTRASQSSSETPFFVRELWDSATAPNLASWYLESRGLPQKSLPEALRGHKAVWCSEAGRKRTAMLAALTDESGRLLAVQRTWVVEQLVYDGFTAYPKGARATDLKAGKKTLGSMGSGAAKLAAAGVVLGLAEGVESALAAAKLFGIPVWATCGASRLGSIQLSEIVQAVIVFGDQGEAGRAAAAKAESEYRRRGYECQTYFPERGCEDFAEMVAK